MPITRLVVVAEAVALSLTVVLCIVIDAIKQVVEAVRNPAAWTAVADPAPEPTARTNDDSE